MKYVSELRGVDLKLLDIWELLLGLRFIKEHISVLTKKSTGTVSVLWNKKYIFCVNVMSVFFILAATYRNDYKIKEN